MRVRILIFTFILSLLLTACNMPSSNPQYDFNQVSTFAAQTVSASGTQGVQTPSTNGAQTSQPTAEGTPPPTASTPGSPDCNRASFVSDVNVPDDTAFILEKPFTKTWRLKNTGTCTWTSAYQLVFDSGERMSGPESTQLTTGTVAPGETIDISVDLIAPALPGTYKSNWQLKSPSGETFALSSGPFWVQIVVRRGGVVVWRTYKQGDSAIEVSAIQYLLRHHGYTLYVDGIFGGATRTNVESFQKDRDIPEDGKVGVETWEEIVVKISQGSNGDAVRAAQFLLQRKFGYTLEVDGVFGPITAEAVKDFQSKQGLTVDGVVTPLTWQKLVGE
jgi:peptidoglycan hydrolase-like protein with peptidoglycan-binding domain